ncbi:BQ5605_C045g12226 [Microbotryum silenes-dioicae]|uniref:BQ5605_C045g12226 protein n=1 Tax=Microbotryum silenes-dioicae TaxID=796604 RepID=A0A2X0MQG9_9BASI|nr:BQ5605_C045g12226 [Microbotryum silenes-dioicae]
MATPTADHVSLMGDLYGKVDATNWGVARERLQNVLKGEGRLKHVTGVLDVGPEPLQSEFTRLEGNNRVDNVATYRNQLRLYRQDVDALDQALAQARNTLIVCLGESTFARVKANATHDLWAALDKDLGRASDDFMRSAKLDALFLCEPFADGEALDPWLANFNRLFEDLVAAHVSRDKAYQRARIDGTSFTQSDFDKWVPPPALSEGVRMDLLKARMPRNLVTVIDSIGTLPSLKQVEGAIRRAALSSSRQIEPIAEALAARVQSRSQPASGRPRSKPSGRPSGPSAPPFLQASRVPGLKERWPHGISHAGRLKLGRMQCRRCYEQGHLGDECTVPSAEVSRRRIAVLAKHNITIGAADIMALVAVDRAPEAQLEDEAYEGYFVVGVPIGDDDTALYLSDIPRYLLDSGVTRHMTTRRDLLIDFKPFTTERVRVIGAFNSSAMATGTGTLRFGVDEASIELHDVLLIPGLSAELVSLAGLMKDGYELSNECDAAGKHTGIVISSATSRLSFALDRNHYVLQASSHPPPRADHLALTATTLPTDVVLWHQRLGHPSWGRLVELVRSGQIPLDVAAVTPDQIRLLDQCDACCAGKTVSSPNREPASHPADAPFSRVFADVWGPSPVPALSGARYLCGITDEFSRFRWARSIRLKSDLSAVLQDFVAMSKTQYGGQGVTTLRTDRGGEFVNHRLRDWLAARGIFHELSTAYEHGQMGVQERSWRTIFNSVRAWLHRLGLPPALWDEAAHAAIYVINLLPSSPLQQRTPDSVLHEPLDPVTDTRRPRLDRVKTWGCAAHVPLAPEQRPNKLAPQSRLCYFVGYSSQSKAWRFFDPVCNKVFELSQARFFEDRFFPAAVSPAMPAIPVAVGLSYPPAPLGIGSAAAPPVAEAPAMAPAAAAPPPVPPALAFSNPGPANAPPDGDRSTRTRRPPDYLGFAHAAQHWEFADHAAIQFNDFDEGDPDTQMYLFEEVSALLAKIDSDDTPSVQAALAGPFCDYWLAAMSVEEGALAAKNAFSKPVRPPAGAIVIGSMWVLLVKRNVEGQINEWETRQSDVSSAYLNGNLGGTEIYMRLPGGDIVRLQRALYGLVQAGREWYKVFTEWILSIGFTRTDSDHAVFVCKEGDRRSFLSIHVDDGLLTGDGDLDGVLCQLKARFEARSTDEASFFLGQSIRREGKTGAAIVNQGHFVDAILEEHHMANASPRPTPLAAPSTLRNRADSGFDPASIPYCAIVGKLLYLSGTTRPDIAFAVSKAARFCNDFTAEHWEALKHILRYLVGTRNFGIRYQKSFQPMSAILEGFVDADHGADPVTCRSVSGYVFMCAGGAISWIAKRQTLVTLSSTEAEYVAMSYAAREGIWLRRLLADLGFEQTAPTRLRGDNQSAITLAKHPAFHARTKHIGIHFHFIRDHIAEGTIEMVWVPTGTMAADILTKGLGTQKHYQKAAIGYLIRSARLFSEAWRCAPTVVFSPRLDYTLVRYTALTDFVWGGPRRNTVARDFVFQAREDGGLGLISIGDIVHSVALRFWDAVAGSDEAIWAPLARESWMSLVAATRDFSPWGFFSSTARVEKLYRDSARWGAVVAAARVTLPTIKSELLTLPELLSLPPRLPSLYAEGAKHTYDDADAVAKFAQIADLYWRDEGKGWALVGHRRGFWQHSKEPALRHEHVWARVGQKLKAKALLPKTAVRPARIPLKEDPHPRCFNFFGLTRPFTIRKLRRLVNTVRFPGKDGQDRALPGGQPQEPRVKRFPEGTSQSGRQRFWSWLHDRFASAAEQNTHWRLMYDVTPTRKKQHVQGHASSPSCLFCGNDAAVIETVSHYFFGCAYSASYWSGVLRILFDKLGIEDTDVDPSTFTQEQLTMGLPLLRGRGRTTSKWMWVRLACAIGFQRLHLLRWHVHQRFEKDRVVAPPSIPSALRAFNRDYLSRAGFVPGARDWEV